MVSTLTLFLISTWLAGSATSAASPAVTLSPVATDMPTNVLPTRAVDGMPLVYVPAGEFVMGSPPDRGNDQEHPQHPVYLNAYWIDQLEVSNQQFQRFVDATGYQTDAERQGFGFVAGQTGLDMLPGADWRHPQGPDSDIAERMRHPVVQVSWHDAQAYCTWAGARLPTEAEWEKAARGNDGRLFPWGNVPDASRANFCDRSCPNHTPEQSLDDGFARSAPVGSFPAGASPYGALDLAGNVAEWTADWYGADYYSHSPVHNPTGPDSGEGKVLRGGSWRNPLLPSTYRNAGNPDLLRLDFVGFRCATSLVALAGLLSVPEATVEPVVSTRTPTGTPAPTATHRTVPTVTPAPSPIATPTATPTPAPSIVPSPTQAPPGTQAGPPVLGNGRPYVIQPGEPIARVAGREYGSSTAWLCIAYYTNLMAEQDDSYHPLENARKVQSGWKIYLPSSEECDAYYAWQAASGEGEPLASVAATPSDVPELTPSATPTNLPPTLSPTPSPTVTVVITTVRETDGAVMVYVPAGDFLMGSDLDQAEAAFRACNAVLRGCERKWFVAEMPQHMVYLDAFWIDRTEVTNRQFEAFVQATGYRTGPEEQGSGWVFTRSEVQEVLGANWRHPEGPASDIASRMDHPVVQVTYDDAWAYCRWAGARLPTEAEWEKAARGTDRRVYPWGDQADGSRYNICDRNCPADWQDLETDDGYSGTAPVASFPSGASPYGALDMAGNVLEWVADWYAEDYYARSPASNPLGPEGGEYRGLRGGSWFGYGLNARVAFRGRINPNAALGNIGFRCAR